MQSLFDCFFVEPLDKICRDRHILTPSSISIKFMMASTILAPRRVVLSSTTLLLSLQHKLVHVLCCTLRSLLSNLCYVLPWSITIFYVKKVVRISPPLKNSWYSNTSRHLRSYLGPRVDSNRGTNKWTVLLGFWTSSNPISMKLMVDSLFLDYWLLNHHSNVDHAT